MIKILAIIFTVLALTSQLAAADVMDKCRSIASVSVGGERLWISATKSAVDACTQIIKQPSFAPDEKAAAYRYRGEMHMYAGATQKAIADFTESIRIKENAPAFADRGWVRFTDRDFSGAIADYDEAIRLSPNYAPLYVERGHIYVINAQFNDAIRDLTQALRLNPKSASAFNTRGYAYVMKGDYERAEKDYSAAINLEPRAIFYANRGYLFQAEHKDDAAISDLRHALLIDPSLTEAMNALKRLGAAAGATGVENTQRVRMGEQLAKKHCGSCHAVGMKDDSRYKGATAFRTYYRRYQNWSLRAPIERAIYSTHANMPPLNFTEAQVNAIVAYINSLVPPR